MCKGTPTTVHSQEAGHHREPVSSPPAFKYDPTWLTFDVARTIIQANRKKVGNMVLLSYEMNPWTIHYKPGAHMFSMNQKFFKAVRETLYDKINQGFQKEDPAFLTKGQPDIMKSLISLFWAWDLDEPDKLGCSRLVPSLGFALQYWPLLCSSRVYEDPYSEHWCENYARIDEHVWSSKNTNSGLLAGATVHGKKQPNLWSFGTQWNTKWYCSIEPDLDKAVCFSKQHLTYLGPQYFVKGNDGDWKGLAKAVDQEMQWTYGLVLDSYDITPKIELTGWAETTTSTQTYTIGRSSIHCTQGQG